MLLPQRNAKLTGARQVDVEIIYEDLDDLESDDDGNVNSVRCAGLTAKPTA